MRDNGIPTDALESGKRKILIVDDDEELVELIVDVLERDGRFEVRSVNNGFDAGMMVKEYHPDLIVLDVMLPDINGKEVCQRVRSDKTMDDVRIICISGMVEEDKIEDLKAVRRQRFPAQAVRGRTLGRADVPSARCRSDGDRLSCCCSVGHLGLHRAAPNSVVEIIAASGCLSCVEAQGWPGKISPIEKSSAAFPGFFVGSAKLRCLDGRTHANRAPDRSRCRN